MLKVFALLSSFMIFDASAVGCGANNKPYCVDYNGSGCPSTFCAGTSGCNICNQCSGSITFSSGVLSCNGRPVSGFISSDGGSSSNSSSAVKK